MPLYEIFAPTVTVFDNEGFSDNTSECVVQFLVRYDCKSVERSKDLMLVTKVESLIFLKDVLITPLNS